MPEDLTPQEEVQETTPTEESESANSELDALFAEVETRDETVSREEFDALKKGVAKFFSEQGRKAKVEGEPKSEVKSSPAQEGYAPVNSVLKSLYFKSNPEAEIVWSHVENEAKKLNKDPFEMYESSLYFKGEAKAQYEKRRQEEEAKSKITKPSSGTPAKPVDISSVKPEDVAALPPDKKVEWLKKQALLERNRAD